MIQGPQTVQPPVDAGNPQRAALIPREASQDRLPASTGHARDFAVERPEESARAGDIMRHQGERVALTRAESMRQIAHRSLTAIQITYTDMGMLAEQAAARDGHGGEPDFLDAAFQGLKSDLLSIVGSAVLNGDKILELPENSGGFLHINLALPSVATVFPDMADTVDALPIPLGDLAGSHLRTGDAARSAREAMEPGSSRLADEVGRLASYRAVFQAKFAHEDRSEPVAADAQTATTDDQMTLPALARSVANRIAAGTDVPFEGQGDRLKNIVRLAVGEKAVPLVSRPSGSGKVTGSAVSPSGPMPLPPALTGPETRRDVLPGDDAETGTSPAADARHRHPGDHQTVGIEPTGLVHPAAAAGQQMTVVHETQALHRAAATNVLPLSESVGEARSHAPERPPVLSTGTGVPATADFPSAGPGVRRSTIPDPRPPGPEPEAIAGPEIPTDIAGAPFVLAMLSLDPVRHQAAADVRLAEVPKLAELDAGRRSAGLIHQVRDVELRADAGLSIVRTTYEAPADRADPYGAKAPDDPGGFIAELIRADTLLRAADAAMEQIIVHLDYLRGLAGEAAGGTSRDRLALDDIFQAVKVNVIDTLAQNTEAKGERMLAGGDRPGAAFVIDLSEGGAAGGGHPIAIPSMRLMDFAPDLARASIGSRDDAAVSLRSIDLAATETAGVREMIAGERALLQRLMSIERAQAASWLPLAHSVLGS